MKSPIPLLGERYRLGPIIGTGGMGAVHRAYDERLGRELAVKVVRAGADAVEQERLRREAQFLAGLDHANLVAVYDVGADHTRSGETVWFAMELMHGPDLRRVICDRGRLTVAEVAHVLAGSSGALQVLHDAGVVHRDLKPANVLLTASVEQPGWQVKLADLGIARLMLGDHLTETGQVVGTAAYLSPEQVSGGKVGPGSDVYALGLLAIEALTGRVPFPGNMVESATARLVRSPDVPAGAGPEWAALLAEMTARDPAARPSAGAVADRVAMLASPAEAIEDPDATAVLPSSVLRPGVPIEDLPTEAIPVATTRVLPGRTDRARAITSEWAPALRRRPVLRGRRGVLAAGAVAVVVGLAGGGAAIVGGAANDSSSAAPRSAPSSTPSATPTHHVAVRATTSPTPRITKTAAATRAPEDRTARVGDDSRGKVQQRLAKLRGELEKRLHHSLPIPLPLIP